MGGKLVVSYVGQADDVALVANDLQQLRLLFKLALDYCQKFNVQLCPSKTKLLVVQPKGSNNIFIPCNSIKMGDNYVDFTSTAEHVAVIRSIEGNMPNLLKRISSFKKALGFVLFCGLARGSRKNPAVAVRIINVYATPVLMSGLASLVLSKKEVSSLDQQYKRTLQNILKLSVSSPRSLVHFVAGSLPATAILHLRQISLFSMICHLSENPLYEHAQNVLHTSSLSKHSWFLQISDILLMYQLPHPLVLLANPPRKEAFKKLVKAKVIDYWEQLLKAEASYLPSLIYFKSQYCSLTKPHKLRTFSGGNPYEVTKARIQLLLFTSQYPSGHLTRYWSRDNPSGYCSFPPCKQNQIVETAQHILLMCPACTKVRQRMFSL